MCESTLIDERDLITLEIRKECAYAADAVIGLDCLMLVTGCDCCDEDSAFELIRVLKRIARGVRADKLCFASDTADDHDAEMLNILEALEAEPGPVIDGRFRSWYLDVDLYDDYRETD